MKIGAYPSDFEERVGFRSIRERIASTALCKAGRLRILHAGFSSDAQAVALATQRVEEMKLILLFRQGFPQEDYVDFSDRLQVLRIATQWYGEQDVADLRLGLMTLWEITQFLRAGADTGALREMALGVDVPEWVMDRLGALLDSSGSISDSASAELQRIRHAIAAMQGQMMRRMQQVLRSAQREGLVDEGAQIVMREGRALIPIPARNKGAFRAVVQGHSSTGQTLFIEPYESLELANQLRDLHQAELEEVRRILCEFTDALRPEHGCLEALYSFLGEIDAILAKARYAVEVGGGRPIISHDPLVALRKAYHPSLYEACVRQGREAVPLQVRLDSAKRILVISGPNAGGKSVALKCVALAVYMHQCGFLPLVGENSELGIFDEILLDIGDTQSIESDLSTYSAHLASMKHFLHRAGRRTLCFIDEFGSGTEPRAGGAIAEAILEGLASSGAMGIVTTHFENLKLCADRLEGLFNGAMRYDLRTLKPLYQLEVDQPGSSFPFEIARQMGLPSAVLQRAESLVGEEYVGLEIQLQEVMQQRKELEQKHRDLMQLHAEIERVQATLRKTSDELQAQRKSIIQQAKAEAQSIIKESNRAVERTIREIKESRADKEQTRRARAALQQHHESLSDPPSIGPTAPSGQSQTEANSFSPGAMVRISGTESVGELVSVSGKKAVVSVGQVYTTVPLSMLEVLSSQQARQLQRDSIRSSNASTVQHRRLNFSSSIDVRGQRGEEALQSVAEFIDDAIMVNVDRVRILHGKGNGILRARIREYLQDHPAVGACYDESEQLGGAGITIVELG